MRNLRFLSTLFIALFTLAAVAQRPEGQKIHLTGKVLEKTTQQPLEYATITVLRPGNPKPVAGGITNPQGNFDIEVPIGTFDIKIEFISFLPKEIKTKTLEADTNLGTISLSEDATQLQEVVVRGETTTVEIKLDKKVYNVGNDLMVKGGTVSDVLDNIPSVSVDAEGNVSLRGNDNVRILIDGRPSNAINIAEALRLIPADAIDKVEVVTNPSARYNSEGGGGLLNIILKKGKNQGVNGVLIGSAGIPESYGISGNVNWKTENFNLYTTTGYNYRTNPGESITNTEYLNPDGTTDRFVNEFRENERLNKSFNTNFGMAWYLDKSTTWTNELRYRKSNGQNPETVTYDYFDAAHAFEERLKRFNDAISDNREVEYSTNFVKKFKREGHELRIDGSFSQERSNDSSQINAGIETTSNFQRQSDNEIKADYVLPLGKDSQFEAGYSGDFSKQYTDYVVNTTNAEGVFGPNPQYSNILEYNENVNGLYTQFGSKISKFSYLLGLRWEDTNIDINQLTTNDFNNKHYNNFFPSAFLTYEISDRSSVSLSYSRRISRPRGRMINPFSNYSSNINIFRGNPDLNAAFTNAFDLGYLKRWNKLTLNTSAYLNRTTDSFEFVRRESGDLVETQVNGATVLTPVILTTPINLATEYRFGFEFTLNYSPYRWWKINSNFNFFRNETQGDFTYTNFNNEVITQNFDNTAYSWFTRLTSKVTLPYNVEWQTNMTYNGPQNNAQGRSRGMFGTNIGLSKDLFKEKATVTLNVQDLFNSRKRITETNLESLNSYSEYQWRRRSINLSFTYRFNKKKEKEKPLREDNNGGGNDEFPG